MWGSALARGLARAGYEVRTVGKDPQRVRDTGAWSDVVILAVPYGAVDDAVRELGDSLEGKTLVDVTNALTADMQLASGCTNSAAESLQQKARGAKGGQSVQHTVRDAYGQVGASMASSSPCLRRPTTPRPRIRSSRWRETSGSMPLTRGHSGTRATWSRSGT